MRKTDFMKVPASTVTLNNKEIEAPVGSVYKAISVIAKRSVQLGIENKKELSEKLEEFQSPVDLLEEVFENKEQIEISKFYERQPKPQSVAMQEWLEGKIYYRDTSETPLAE